mmetsp:Transcript_58160/g.161082  ORF Transcript_58160/g.161082 Transcript_58160/m.161082 type:complete len:209 (+) Transcript_58160:370-996(+)
MTRPPRPIRPRHEYETGVLRPASPTAAAASSSSPQNMLTRGKFSVPGNSYVARVAYGSMNDGTEGRGALAFFSPPCIERSGLLPSLSPAPSSSTSSSSPSTSSSARLRFFLLRFTFFSMSKPVSARGAESFCRSSSRSMLTARASPEPLVKSCICCSNTSSFTTSEICFTFSRCRTRSSRFRIRSQSRRSCCILRKDSMSFLRCLRSL